MAQRKRSEKSDTDVFDAASEVDRADQAAPVDPDDAVSGDIDPRSVPEDMPVPESNVASTGTEDAWQADPADVADQATPVPLGDDYDGAYDDEEP